MEQWGWNFNHIIYSEKDKSKPPSDADIDYILDKFVEAVEDRDLFCGGGCSLIRVDKVFCEICHKNEADIEWEICSGCLNRLAIKQGYTKICKV